MPLFNDFDASDERRLLHLKMASEADEISAKTEEGEVDKNSNVSKPSKPSKKYSSPEPTTFRPGTRNYNYPTSKKLSLSATPTPVPTLHLRHHSMDEETDAEVDRVTQSLETAVRKISRGSPNLLTSPNRSPNMLTGDLASRFAGLSGMARGYEQYRESLVCLRPTGEYGEASSDDLSSEWESSDAETNNNNKADTPTKSGATLSPFSAVKWAAEVAKKKLEEQQKELEANKNEVKSEKEAVIPDPPLQPRTKSRVSFV